MRGEQVVALLTVCAVLGCSRKQDGAPPAPPTPASAPVRVHQLTLIPPREPQIRAGAPVLFRLESTPPLPSDGLSTWTFTSAAKTFTMTGQGPTLEAVFPTGGVYSVRAQAGAVASNEVSVPVYRVSLADGEGRPLTEARVAVLPSEAFNDQGRLREEAIASSPDRVRILVEDPAPGAPDTVTVANLPLPLTGPPDRRLTRSLLLVGDKHDAAAAPAGSVLPAMPGARIDFQYRGAAAGSVQVGPASIYQIPIRFIAVGPGLPPTAEIEQGIALRLAQANAVWEPLGRRFVRAAVVRMDHFPGLFSIRGRAAGADGQGRPSKCGILVDGNEISVPGVWRDDGAPMSPKATAQLLRIKARESHTFTLLDGLLSGDREAVVVKVQRKDGTFAAVQPLPERNDVSQAVSPLPSRLLDGIEVSPARGVLSLEEIALLGSAGGAASDGFDVFIVTWLHALGAQPAFKVHREGLARGSAPGAAIVSWKLLDGGGRYPYGLARALGELLLPGPPASGDTLFAEPLSETAGVGAHKRVTAATALKIAERGRGLSGKK